MSVSSWFEPFNTNLRMSKDNVDTISYRYRGITQLLKENITANQKTTQQLLKAILHQAFEVEEREEVNA